jgi:50S ribosomal protein L16 3-hydroxylase
MQLQFAPTQPPHRDYFLTQGSGLVLDARSRMLYDQQHVFINGDAYLAAGRDALHMRTLADQRRLDGKSVRQLSNGAWGLLQLWIEVGWLHAH